ncbi:MAG: cobalamin B12-binding domain-containing protein [Clostridiales Family XIII bacterium]|nr:cobalamin B12-binding domain-containing protein [Clostridiales Family XIII bacterium]
MNDRKIRVLMAKVGLDGHDVGVKVVARGLADAGMEVIYTGLRQTPQTVVQTAIQEDVDIIGISLLSGAHMVFIPEILRLLKENRAEDINVFCGGVIPVEDIAELKKLGIKEVFVAGSSMKDIVGCVKEAFQARHERQRKGQNDA